MQKLRIFLSALTLVSALAVLAGCANTASNPNFFSTLVLDLHVKGTFQQNNPNIFYYVVIDTSGNAGLGPRVFGPDPNIRPPRLEATLPFSASNLPGVTQAQSTWTDYFQLGGGSSSIQRGQLGSDGIVRTVDPQYTTQKWSLQDGGKTLSLQIQLSDLRATPGTITMNFACADFRGFYYDRWAINSDFIAVAAAANSPELRDTNFQPPYGLTTNELQAIKVLPVGVNSDNVDFDSYRIRIIS